RREPDPDRILALRAQHRGEGEGHRAGGRGGQEHATIHGRLLLTHGSGANVAPMIGVGWRAVKCAPPRFPRTRRATLPRMPHVGAPIKRPDDPRLLTGRGRYVDDLTLPRMVHVAFVRSPHAHATITALDVSAAQRAPS